jgi:hypothetical protein
VVAGLAATARALVSEADGDAVLAADPSLAFRRPDVAEAVDRFMATAP